MTIISLLNQSGGNFAEIPGEVSAVAQGGEVVSPLQEQDFYCTIIGKTITNTSGIMHIVHWIYRGGYHGALARIKTG